MSMRCCLPNTHLTVVTEQPIDYMESKTVALRQLFTKKIALYQSALEELFHGNGFAILLIICHHENIHST